MIFKLKNKPIMQKLIIFYVYALFTVFMLYLPAVRIQEITLRNILYGVITLTAAVSYIVLLLKKKVTCRKRLYRIDLCMLMALALSLGQMCIHAFQGKSDYEEYLLVSISVFAYLLISASGKGTGASFEPVYLDGLLAACAVIYAWLFVRLFRLPELQGPVGLLTEDAGTLRAFLVLGGTVGIVRYCVNRSKKRDAFYLAVSAAVFFLLFLQKDMPGILLISGLLLLIPVLFPPTAEFIKRDLLMAFLFFFIGSNVPLVVNYSGLLKAEVSFDLLNSVYLDLAVAAAGAAVFFYWERVPKEIPADWIVLKRLRRVFLFLCRVFFIALAAVLCLGSMEELKGRMGMKALRGLADGVKTGLARADGTFMQALEQYGALGFVLMTVSFAVMLTRLGRRYECTGRSAVLTSIAGMFMAQSFFYRQQVVTTPVYAALVTFALFQEGKKEEHDEKLRKNKEMGKAADTGGAVERAVGEHGVRQSDGTAGGSDGSGGRSGRRVCSGDGSGKRV